MDDGAFNYNPNANVDDGSCIPLIFGCIDPTAFNYCDTCNTDNGSCIAVVNGCMDSLALNYNPLANVDNGSCILPLTGCTDITAVNYNINANIPDSSCYYESGCSASVPYYVPDACFEWVVQVDPYCCDDSWDGTCDVLYTYCQDGWTGPTDITMYERSALIPFPNPTKDYINFREEVDVLVIDQLGKKHLLYKNTKRIKLDKGINYLKVTKDKVNFTTIIIVQ